MGAAAHNMIATSQTADFYIWQELLAAFINTVHRDKSFVQLRKDSRFPTLRGLTDEAAGRVRQRYYYIRQQNRVQLTKLCKKYNIPITEETLGTYASRSCLSSSQSFQNSCCAPSLDRRTRPCSRRRRRRPSSSSSSSSTRNEDIILIAITHAEHCCPSSCSSR
jgi:hypothetical protein